MLIVDPLQPAALPERPPYVTAADVVAGYVLAAIAAIALAVLGCAAAVLG
jgi:hypothetical protein